MIDVCSGCGLHLAEDAGAIVAVVEDDSAPVMFGLCGKCAELRRDMAIPLRYAPHLEREAANGIIVTRLHKRDIILLRWQDEAHFWHTMPEGTKTYA